MSKFCKNCGKQLDDAMRFCDGCGAPQPAAPQQPQYQAPQQPQYQAPQQPLYQQPQYQAPQQPQYQAPQPQYQAPVAAAPKAAKKPGFDFNKLIDEVKTFANGLVNRCKADKKFLYQCIGIGAAVVVVLVVLLALVFGGNGGMTKPIDNMIAVTFKGKVEKIKDMAPAEYWEWYEDEYDMDIDDIIEEAEDEFDDMMDYYEEEYGDNVRVSYKVKDKKKLSDKKLEGIAEALADRYDLDEDKFTEAYELEIEMTIKGSEDDDEDDAEFSVIKYKGKWYGITWYKSGSDYSASFMTGF